MPKLLTGVDRAAFVAALVHRLRTRGVDVGMTSATAFTEALAVVPPVRVRDLYWSARITLVSRQEDLALFDRVFDAAFADAVLAVDPNARRTGTTELPERPADALTPVTGDRDEEGTGSTLPWHTLPRHVDGTEDDNPVVLPELLPSAVARIADTPLDELDGRQLAVLGRWLERSAHEWPTRRSRRLGVGAAGSRIALRATMAASRRTGGEAFALRRLEAVRRPLPVTLLCDVSQSMQSHSTAYLHLMRAFAEPAGRDVRVLDLADPADPGAPAGVTHDRHRPGQRAGRRPVRRHAPGRLPQGAPRVPARTRHPWRRAGDRLRRLGQRPARAARGHDGPRVPPGAPGGLAQPPRRGAGLRAAGRLDGGGAAVLRRLPARAHGPGAARGVGGGPRP